MREREREGGRVRESEGEREVNAVIPGLRSKCMTGGLISLR